MIAYGSGRNFRHKSLQELLKEPSKAKTLLAFHPLIGCDTTSLFFNKGKKTAWSVRQSLQELTLALQQLSCPDISVDVVSDHSRAHKIFVVKLYGVKEKEINRVDAARKDLFLTKGKDSELIPPSCDELPSTHFEGSLPEQILMGKCSE